MRFPRTRRWTAFAATGVLVTAGLVSIPTSAYAAVSCHVVYATNERNNGFTASVTINNTGDALSSWSLGWTYANAGQKVTNFWSSKITQSGQNVTATNEAWNGSVPSGGSVTFGFNGSHTGQNPKPTTFT